MSFDALGGAVADVAAADSAFPWRRRSRSSSTPRPGTTRTPRSTRRRSTRSSAASASTLAPWLGASAYVNYADPSITDFGTAYWGPNLARLKQVKKTYDPNNVFSFPQSVPLS